MRPQASLWAKHSKQVPGAPTNEMARQSQNRFTHHTTRIWPTNNYETRDLETAKTHPRVVVSRKKRKNQFRCPCMFSFSVILKSVGWVVYCTFPCSFSLILRRGILNICFRLFSATLFFIHSEIVLLLRIPKIKISLNIFQVWSLSGYLSYPSA